MVLANVIVPALAYWVEAVQNCYAWTTFFLALGLRKTVKKVRAAHHYMRVPVLTSPYEFDGCRVNLQGDSGDFGVTRLVPEMQQYVKASWLMRPAGPSFLRMDNLFPRPWTPKSTQKGSRRALLHESSW